MMLNIAKLNYLCNDGKAECVNARGCVLGLDFARVTSAGLRMQYTEYTIDRSCSSVPEGTLRHGSWHNVPFTAALKYLKWYFGWHVSYHSTAFYHCVS